MTSVNLPHPDNVSPDEFAGQVYRKLTETDAIEATTVDGVAADSDVSDLQDDVSDLQSTVATQVTLAELQRIIALLRLTDLSDFIVAAGTVGGREYSTMTLAGRVGIVQYETGDWNMDTTTFGPTLNLTSLGISRTDVFAMGMVIYADSNNAVDQLERGGQMRITQSGSDWLLQPSRTTSGYFDDPGFNQTSFNRGRGWALYIPS